MVSGLLSFPVILCLCSKNAFSIGKNTAIRLVKVFGIFLYPWTHQLRVMSHIKSLSNALKVGLHFSLLTSLKTVPHRKKYRMLKSLQNILWQNTNKRKPVTVNHSIPSHHLFCTSFDFPYFSRREAPDTICSDVNMSSQICSDNILPTQG